MLTTSRASSCCVQRDYVRNIYEHFLSQDETREKEEAEKIDVSYICAWERNHEQCIGHKRPHELSVCYLSGPEPENDFSELISLGIEPQNIWAFESNNNTYLQALTSFDTSSFCQPKIVRTSIERFFETTPKQFDIVYIDACCPLVSDQHALRCIACMFRYHRLASPGVLISNFAEVNISNISDRNEYYDLITRMELIKRFPNASLVDKNGVVIFRENYNDIIEEVKQDFQKYYGDYITSIICDTGSISIPTLRFMNSHYLGTLTSSNPKTIPKYDFIDVNRVKYNTLYKYTISNKFLEQNGADFIGVNRCNKLVSEFSGQWTYDLLQCFDKLYSFRNLGEDINSSLFPALDFFNNAKNMHQFLDQPNRILLFDAIINQLSYPMHYCSEKIKRLSYIAKQTRMYTDLVVFDECRYIYEWLPATHQVQNAFSNPSWQYTFRFALDGLVKQRIKYNNEFFFQGSVVSKDVKGFEAKHIGDRIALN